MVAIEQIHRPTRERFVRDYLAPRRPVKVSGALDDWPAMQRWSFELFSSLGRDVQVDVEVGDCLTRSTVRQQWTFADYVSSVVSDRLNEANGGIPYLSVFPLLERFPELEADLGTRLWPNRHFFHVAWIGPAGTFSSLHYDRLNGLLAQIRGRKRIVLYEPEQWAYMYESRKFDWGTVISEVDPRHPRYDRWPLFRNARGTEVLLEPGELLFIPARWPHHVLALEPSISLTCFGQTRMDVLFGEPRDQILGKLHQLGLYRRGNCTCHASRVGFRGLPD